LTPRLTLPDALRALALLAVLAVNAMGYLHAPWGAVLGEPSPAHSSGAAITWGLVAAVLQGKGYPMLAFLFGMSLYLAQRGQPQQMALARAVLRQKKLLKLGVLHGVLVYFGDILTLYALVGWHVLTRVREPWRTFRPRLRRALGWALAGALVSTALALWAQAQGPAPSGDAGALGGGSLVQTQHLLQFWLLNASAYAVIQLVTLPLVWPVLRLCMLCGVAAARLRLLTHPRWRQRLVRMARRWGPPLALLNVGYGVGYGVAYATGLLVVDRGGAQNNSAAAWFELLGSLAGPPLAAVYVVLLALLARGGQAAWCQWLAPLGRCTLTLYITHGVLCAVLFTGVGLCLQWGTTGTALFALLLWALALLAANATARATAGLRWPLEAWMARR
jgi:uncharacterized protein